MLVIRVGNNKPLVRIANREDPDKTASSASALFVWSFLADNWAKFLEHSVVNDLYKTELYNWRNSLK